MKKRILGFVLVIILCMSLIPTTVFAEGAAISLNKTVYAPGERIVVTVTGITQQMLEDDAFVSIYKAGAEHSEWGEYFWVKAGDSQDEFRAPDVYGSYEMRLYRKNGEYTDETFVMKVAFRVGDVTLANSGRIELEKDAYLANSKIPVKVFEITEQMEMDDAFVSIYKKGAQHNQWGVYAYPKAGDSTIELTAPNLNGDFEMRLYSEDHFYSDATFVMSVPFKLSGATIPKGSSWAAGEIEKAEALGLIPDSIKKADLTKPITREEFAELVIKLYEKTTGVAATPASPNPFTDTKNPEILKAFKLGITTGTSKTTFAPKELTNREQVATMLSRAIRGMAPDGNFSTSGAPTFSDQKDISSWALEHVLFMARLGIIKGSGDKFMPKASTTAQTAAGYATTTREQAIAMSVRSFEKMESGDLGALGENTSTTPAQPTQSVEQTEPVSATSGIPKNDKGIAGVWLGTFFPYDGLGLRWRWMTFFEDGTFYFDLPLKGFIGYDRSESKITHEDFWGTYTFSGGSGIWKYNRETGNGSEMTIADDGGLDTGGYGRFYRCVSVNGLKLNGAYTTYADSTDPDLKKEGIKPVIRFKEDGSFVDEGLYMMLDPLSENEAQRAPGSGTYEIKDFSLILHYSDGRTKQAVFTLGYKGSIEESPTYIFMHLRRMTKMP